MYVMIKEIINLNINEENPNLSTFECIYNGVEKSEHEIEEIDVSLYTAMKKALSKSYNTIKSGEVSVVEQDNYGLIITTTTDGHRCVIYILGSFTCSAGVLELFRDSVEKVAKNSSHGLWGADKPQTSNDSDKVEVNENKSNLSKRILGGVGIVAVTALAVYALTKFFPIDGESV